MYDDHFHLSSGQQVLLARWPTMPLSTDLVDRAETATTIYIGRSPYSDKALVIAVVGEVAIKVEIGWEEAIFYYGLVTGSAAAGSHRILWRRNRFHPRFRSRYTTFDNSVKRSRSRSDARTGICVRSHRKADLAGTHTICSGGDGDPIIVTGRQPGAIGAAGRHRHA